MATAKSAPGFVTVACKLPQGLHIPMMDGTHLKLHGSASPFAVAGHGMTQVKATVWSEVEQRFAEAAWLVNEAVFAMKKPDSAADKAQDLSKVDRGFDPIDPAKPGGAVPGTDMIQAEGEKDPRES